MCLISAFKTFCTCTKTRPQSGISTEDCSKMPFLTSNHKVKALQEKKQLDTIFFILFTEWDIFKILALWSAILNRSSTVTYISVTVFSLLWVSCSSTSTLRYLSSNLRMKTMSSMGIPVEDVRGRAQLQSVSTCCILQSQIQISTGQQSIAYQHTAMQCNVDQSAISVAWEWLRSKRKCISSDGHDYSQRPPGTVAAFLRHKWLHLLTYKISYPVLNCKQLEKSTEAVGRLPSPHIIISNDLW